MMRNMSQWDTAEQYTSSQLSASSTWWQRWTVWELSVQPAACYYIRKLKAEKPKGHTYIKQMAAHPANCSVHVCAAAQLCMSVCGWSFLSSFWTEVFTLCNARCTKQAGWVTRESSCFPRRSESTLHQFRWEHEAAVSGHRSLCKNQQLTQWTFLQRHFIRGKSHGGTVTGFQLVYSVCVYMC